ncbi:MAG: hypothetical protein KF812_04250 [Fimbriimonadaceae bacterium]|nr:hypothetical protein [Fimbriimonadaceae bacterium]
MEWKSSAGGAKLVGELEACRADMNAALGAVERWLQGLASPENALYGLEAFPGGAKALATIVANSPAWTDVLIQNPEFGMIMTDPSMICAPVQASAIEAEAARLAELSVSYSHVLDRIRYLRQRETFRTVANELCGFWSPPEAWAALSELADGLIRAVVSRLPDAPSAPITVVAFGKLGANELNLSSDIDLVYVTEDDAPDGDEKKTEKWAGALGRALSDRMGRGAVYRVDTRLRPFGRSGPLVPKWRSVRRYYRDYAEAWEQMAIIRSRVVVGPGAEEWEAIRQETAFRGVRGEWVLDELRSMRQQLDTFRGENDLKRAPGGIRDIEFAVQVRQLLFGAGNPYLQTRRTHDAIDALASIGQMSVETADRLKRAYEQLRHWEHGLQSVADSQTHDLPTTQAAWERLAAACRVADGDTLKGQVDETRAEVRVLYDELMSPGAIRSPVNTRSLVLGSLGEKRPNAERWLEAMTDPGPIYQALAENESSLLRVQTVLERAPILAPELGGQPALTELIVSGEVMEPDVLTSGGDWSPDRLRRAWLTAAVRWTLGVSDFGHEWSVAMDAAFARLSEPFGLLALGSWAIRTPGLRSDADAFLWAAEGVTESDAQRVLQGAQKWRSGGCPVTLDLRLRPEGRQGALAVTEPMLRRYRETRMEPWERMALARFRAVARADEASAAILNVVLSDPLTPMESASLASMKHRIETERASGAHRMRHLKHSPGGLDDIEWIAFLGVLHHPEVREVGPELPALLTRLAGVGWLNVVESAALTVAHAQLHNVRLTIALQGFTDDVIPENPDKLSVLAHQFGASDGNAWLEQMEANRKEVRAIFDDVTKRSAN